MLKDLIKTNRSYRRFYEDHPIDYETLLELIELARLSPSGANLQPLKFILSNNEEKNAKIYPYLGWAGYLKDWDGPESGERPAAYIIILGDTTIRKSFGVDPGIAAQSILLGAVEKGLGGCMLASIKKDDLRAELQIPQEMEITLVLALGEPKEKIVMDPIGEDGSIKYWRDEDAVHHVPKRALDSLILDI